MELFIFFVLVVIVHLGPVDSKTVVTAFTKGTAQLPCNFPESEPMKWQKMMVFWQKETSAGPEVVHETFYGQEKMTNLNLKYVNRSRLDPNTLLLYLLDIHIADEGTYSCIVHIKGDKWLEKKHTFSLQLKVTANFSSPKIAPVAEGKMKRGTTVNLMCYSDQGYPEPRGMLWVVSDKNGSSNYSGDMQTAQDPETKLYNITSTLTLTFTVETNLSCVLHHTQDVGFLSSETRLIELEDDLGKKTTSQLIIGICIGIFLFVAVVGFVIFVVRKKCNRTTNHQDGAPEVDANGQPEEREELYNLTTTASTVTCESLTPVKGLELEFPLSIYDCNSLRRELNCTDE